MLFTVEQLRERMYGHLKPRNVLALDVARFEGQDFHSIEQTAVVCRAPAALTTDPVRFWVSSVAQLPWWSGRGTRGARSRYIKGSLCRHLFEAQFNTLVAEHIGGLKRPVRLPLHRGTGRFLGAMQMHGSDDSFDVSALATWEDELISFFYDMTG